MLEKIVASAILILLIVLAFGKYFCNIFLWLLVPKRTIIMGTIVSFLEKEREFYYSPQNQSNLMNDGISFGFFDSNIVTLKSTLKDHFIRVRSVGKKYTIQVSDQLFNVIKQQKVDNITLPCEKFSWECIYNESTV